MEPWAIENLMITGATILAVLIPVVGFTVRFALRPVLRDLKEMRQGQGPTAEQLREPRLDRIEAQLETLESSVGRLLDITEFDHQLKSGDPPAGGQ